MYLGLVTYIITVWLLSITLVEQEHYNKSGIRDPRCNTTPTSQSCSISPFMLHYSQLAMYFSEKNIFCTLIVSYVWQRRQTVVRYHQLCITFTLMQRPLNIWTKHSNGQIHCIVHGTLVALLIPNVFLIFLEKYFSMHKKADGMT